MQRFFACFAAFAIAFVSTPAHAETLESKLPAFSGISSMVIYRVPANVMTIVALTPILLEKYSKFRLEVFANTNPDRIRRLYDAASSTSLLGDCTSPVGDVRWEVVFMDRAHRVLQRISLTDGGSCIDIDGKFFIARGPLILLLRREYGSLES